MSMLSTIALLERKPAISRDLFSRYWRDVHGVMAARIPGFWSYVQHHVTPLGGLGSRIVEPFEGIAVVRFRSEEDRAGLMGSAVTPHIHRDEQNVFRRALLYSLDTGDTVAMGASLPEDAPSWFVLVPEGSDGQVLAQTALRSGAASVEMFGLGNADPTGWNEVDASEAGASRLFDFVLQIRGEQDAVATALRELVAASRAECACYQVDERYEMVAQGLPTQLGLRGLDAVKTIIEAGADNQLEPAVLRAVYGPIAG